MGGQTVKSALGRPSQADRRDVGDEGECHGRGVVAEAVFRSNS